jgi:curved DNA-binding protein
LKNYYRILGIEQIATKLEIRKAFRKSALAAHPDKNSNSNAHEIFIEINEAYEILSDEQARKEYDVKLILNQNNEAERERERQREQESKPEKEPEEVFENNFSSKYSKEYAEKYSSMRYEDFERILDEMVDVGEKIKKGSQVGCGFIVMVGCGLLTLLAIFNIANSGSAGISIIVIIIFGLLTLLGFAMTRKDY